MRRFLLSYRSVSLRLLLRPETRATWRAPGPTLADFALNWTSSHSSYPARNKPSPTPINVNPAGVFAIRSMSKPPKMLIRIETTIEQPMPHAMPADASCSRSSGVGGFNTFGSPRPSTRLRTLSQSFATGSRNPGILLAVHGEPARVVFCPIDIEGQRRQSRDVTVL